MRNLLLLAFVFALLSMPLYAQPSTGTPPFGSFGGGPDVIDLGNLNVHFDFLRISKPGRQLPFSYVLSYDNSFWAPSSGTWTAPSGYGWRGQEEAFGGYISYRQTQGTCRIFHVVNGYDPGVYTFNRYPFTGYRDAGGTNHQFSAVVDDYYDTYGSDGPCPSNTQNSSATVTLPDGTGSTITVDDGPDATIYPVNGGAIYPPLNGAGPVTIVDRNGNSISTNDGVNFTDSLGQTALVISGTPASGPVRYYYQATVTPGGVTCPASMTYCGQVTVAYQSFTLQTAFNCSGVGDPTVTGVYLPTSVTRQDGGVYSIQYEPTPNSSGNYTGRISQITLPTGATIQYQYTGANDGTNCSDGSTMGLTKTVSGNIDTAGTWAYTRSGNTTTVVDAANNTTNIQFQGIYETERDTYAAAPAARFCKRFTPATTARPIPATAQP